MSRTPRPLQPEEPEEEPSPISYRGPLLSDNSFQYRDTVYRYDNGQWFRGTLLQGQTPGSFELVPGDLQAALSQKYKVYSPTEQRILQNLERIGRGRPEAGRAGGVLPRAGEDPVLTALSSPVPELGGRSLSSIIGGANVAKILASGLTTDGSQVQRAFDLAREATEGFSRLPAARAPSPVQRAPQAVARAPSPVRRVPPAALPSVAAPSPTGIFEQLRQAILFEQISGRPVGRTSRIMAHGFAALDGRSLNNLFPEGSEARNDIATRINQLVNNPRSSVTDVTGLCSTVLSAAVALEVRQRIEAARQHPGLGKTRSVMDAPLAALGGSKLVDILRPEARHEVDREVRVYVNRDPISRDTEDMARILSTVARDLSLEAPPVLAAAPAAQPVARAPSPVRQVPPAPHAHEPRPPGIREELTNAMLGERDTRRPVGRTSRIMAHEFAALDGKSLNDLFPQESSARRDIANRINHLVTNSQSTHSDLVKLLDEVTAEAVASEIKDKMAAARKIQGPGKTTSVMHTPIRALGGVTTLDNVLMPDIRKQVNRAVMGYVNHASTQSDSVYSDPILSAVRRSVRGEGAPVHVPPIGRGDVVRGRHDPIPAPPAVHRPPQRDDGLRRR